MSKLAQSVKLLCCIREMSGSNRSWGTNSWLNFLVVFLRTSRLMSGWHPILGHNHFLPHLIQSIAKLYHSVTRRYIAWVTNSIVKYRKQNVSLEGRWELHCTLLFRFLSWTRPREAQRVCLPSIRLSILLSACYLCSEWFNSKTLWPREWPITHEGVIPEMYLSAQAIILVTSTAQGREINFFLTMNCLFQESIANSSSM